MYWRCGQITCLVKKQLKKGCFYLQSEAIIVWIAETALLKMFFLDRIKRQTLIIESGSSVR